MASLLIDALVDGDIQLSGIYAIVFTLSLSITLLTRHGYWLGNAELFVIIRQALTGLLYKKSVRLGLRSISE